MKAVTMKDKKTGPFYDGILNITIHTTLTRTLFQFFLQIFIFKRITSLANHHMTNGIIVCIKALVKFNQNQKVLRIL